MRSESSGKQNFTIDLTREKKKGGGRNLVKISVVNILCNIPLDRFRK